MVDVASDFDDEPSEPPVLEAFEPAAPPAESPLSLDAPDSVFDLERLELERSFFAQPEPLKWTDGATKAFRSVPSAPQAGQNRGAGASMPWMNSVRVEQVEQT